MRLEDFVMYAWIGEDELGSGEVGIKQGVCPAGIIPMAMVHLSAADQDYIKDQLQWQANQYGKPITLVKLKVIEEVIRLEPR